MFYLEGREDGLYIWETDPDCDSILHLLHKVSDSCFKQEISYYRPGIDSETTTVANIRRNLIAMSESFESILGAACLEEL